MINMHDSKKGFLLIQEVKIAKETFHNRMGITFVIRIYSPGQVYPHIIYLSD